MRHKTFRIPRRPTNEYTILKRLLTRTTISFKAIQQIEALLLLDAKYNIADVAALVGFGTKTVTMWRNSYSKIGLASLLVYTEKAEGVKSIGKKVIRLRNAPEEKTEEDKTGNDIDNDAKSEDKKCDPTIDNLVTK